MSLSSIMNIGSSTIGACGDVSRNVMLTPAPFATPGITVVSFRSSPIFSSSDF
jgi:hypothetical protein